MSSVEQHATVDQLKALLDRADAAVSEAKENLETAKKNVKKAHDFWMEVNLQYTEAKVRAELGEK